MAFTQTIVDSNGVPPKMEIRSIRQKPGRFLWSSSSKQYNK